MGDFSRCQVKPKHYSPVVSANYVDNSKQKIVKGEGTRVYGERCPTCQSTHLLKNGTCKVCQDCGSTTGCS